MKSRYGLTTLYIALALLNSVALFAQSKLSFEVASVKVGDPMSTNFGTHLLPGGNFNATDVTLKFLVQYAFGLNDYQVLDGPNWIATAKFTINAKPDSAQRIAPGPDGRAKVLLMLQTLLEDRFKLSTHWETKEGAVYELLVAKTGSRLRATNPNFKGQDLAGGNGQLTGQGVTIAMLLSNLARQLGRPIIDRTGLTGRYDFKLTYTPDLVSAEASTGDSRGPSIFTALQEQLGLKLESAKGPVQFLVIDRAEKPKEN